MPPKISILILNYKRYFDTEQCLVSVLKSSLPSNTEIVIIDNSPDQQSFEYLNSRFPQVKILKNKTNLGFAAGNNRGIRYALNRHATHILLLNPDTIVPRSFLKPLLNGMNKSSAAITAPAIKHFQANQPFFGLEGSVDWLTAKASHINLKRIKNNKLRPAEFVTFACVLIQSKVFDSIGLLDQKYFMYLEDVDFCLKARQAGFKIVLNPAVVISHNTSSSFKRPTDKLILSFKSQLVFIGHWFPFPKNIIPYLYAMLFYPYLYLLWTAQSLKHHFFLTKKIL